MLRLYFWSVKRAVRRALAADESSAENSRSSAYAKCLRYPSADVMPETKVRP